MEIKTSDTEKDFAKELGLRLRKARIERQETQADLGTRAGISRQLVVRMEKGEASVGLEKWLKVSSILGLLNTWSDVLKIPIDPFKEYDKKQEQLEKMWKTRVRKG